jgi:hypothetical protein
MVFLCPVLDVSLFDFERNLVILVFVCCLMVCLHMTI